MRERQDRVVITINMNRDLDEWTRQTAEKLGLSRSELVNNAIAAYRQGVMTELSETEHEPSMERIA